MNRLTTSALVILSFILVQVSFGQKSPSEKEENYSYILLKERAEKDTELKTDEKSPLTEEDKTDFKGLHYYPPDEQYRVFAVLERFDNPFHFKMKTTTERLPEYATYGRISFQIRDTTYQLFVYQNIELMKKPGYEKYLFIPFNDNTNAETTYGGGRFLDTNIPESDTLILDFNKAYNPYCAYNSRYSCPIPPKENFLDTRIEAGEMKWHD